MKRINLLIYGGILVSQILFAQHASIKETQCTIKTYPFSDPDPVADPSKTIYPYYRFDGFSNKVIERRWKVVEMENPFIKVSILPEIGGKIWGCTDKINNKEFIYQNNVIKFRDIAMRGPWTSGGIEFNFGLIGHAPSTSTPVDYLTRNNPDGSVSCFVSSYEWMTGTWWSVEINLLPDKAFFSTNVIWHNDTEVQQPFYQWMNAAYKAKEDAELCYPGTHYIGHGGDVHVFPVDKLGNNLSWYKNNNFGGSKSYHVLGKYNDYYGIYWHEDDFGSMHYAKYNDKLGMKIFLWSQSREGEIWKDLLTDNDGQYIELQSGKIFNQPASSSAYTPYKHPSFGPMDTESWEEYWYPVHNTRGAVKSNNYGTLNVLREDNYLKLFFCPLEKIDTELKIYNRDSLIHTFLLKADALVNWKDSISLTSDLKDGELKISVGKNKLQYSEIKSDNILERPKAISDNINWDSAQGLYTKGKQFLNQKEWKNAELNLKASLEKEPDFKPALSALASLYYKCGKYKDALYYCNEGLRMDTYDGALNYLYGLCNQKLESTIDAKDGFSIAAHSVTFRSAAYAKLAEIYLKESDWEKAIYYASRSLAFNEMNLTAQKALLVAYRKSNNKAKAEDLITNLLDKIPLFHPIRFEAFMNGLLEEKEFNTLIRNEQPNEVYIDLADWYISIGCNDDALKILSYTNNCPIAGYMIAYLQNNAKKKTASLATLSNTNSLEVDYIFPYRPETIKYLEWARDIMPCWKIDYYEALIHWSNLDKERSLAIMNRIDKINYAPFYLSRAILKSGDKKEKDLLLAEKIDKSWRSGFALINYYMENGMWKESYEIGKQYSKKYPTNYYIGLKYAGTLNKMGKYNDALSLLEKLQVLPNEGAYAGREVYRSANLNQSLEYIKRNNYQMALQKISDSEKWPENLGVGKPYDEEIDNRLEKYLKAIIYEKLGRRTETEKLFQEIVSFQTELSHFRSTDLLKALVLKKSGKELESNMLIDSWKTALGNNPIAQWCIATYMGDNESANRLLNKKNLEKQATPWEVQYRDPDFELIVNLLINI